ncbi:hypothetical protein Pint_24033 [Pistacia integerrima]|uniref:Uncharacterized protein n=1 Tax=Pistacia integerrima TaxID=434235 RepID=A0ACC0YJ63_9ROSI|nr:hypothetical protein Pint_24033 [Pistacia integerrima]
MCQKCFNATTATASNATSTTSTTTAATTTASSTSADATGTTSQSPESDRQKGDVVEKRVVNRCSGCRRKVGLTGFRCRCGELFCGEHRYSDRHDCSYDYKSAGRDAIARENPVVKAAKIVRV